MIQKSQPPKASQFPAVDLNEHIQKLLPLARGSLYYAAQYAALTAHPKAHEALDLLTSQNELLTIIKRSHVLTDACHLTPFELRAALDSSIETLASKDVLIESYRELHRKRFDFIPTSH